MKTSKTPYEKLEKEYQEALMDKKFYKQMYEGGGYHTFEELKKLTCVFKNILLLVTGVLVFLAGLVLFLCFRLF